MDFTKFIEIEINHGDVREWLEPLGGDAWYYQHSLDHGRQLVDSAFVQTFTTSTYESASRVEINKKVSRVIIYMN